MMSNNIISRQKFLTFVIYYFRILGITFGGVSLDKNGNIIKSEFWYYFGWFGFGINIIFSIITSITSSLVVIQSMNPLKDIKMFLILGILGNIFGSVVITAVSMINQKYGFKIIEIAIEYLLIKLNKLKKVIIIWIFHLIICFSLYIFEIIFYFNPIILTLTTLFCI